MSESDDPQAIAQLLKAILDQNTRQTAQIVQAINMQTRALVSALNRQTSLLAFQQLSDRILEFTYEDRLIRFFLPEGDFDFVQSIILRNRSFYEEPVLRSVRDSVDLRGKVVLDIGANIGNHAVYFAAICGVARCIAFEPNPAPAAILRRNLELNGLDNVELRQVALSDQPGSLRVARLVPGNIGATSFAESGEGVIPAVRLDDLDPGRVDFIKLDVEGMAVKVLEGARETIAASRPGILIELFPVEYDQGAAILGNLGYRRVKAMAGDNHLFLPLPA
ncbi:FkbM family methyltransferase [Paracoccus sp. (in: a-proteobacteria)]|uniref:FkbM family methyltransferase n=1 Tax=Paracoccus sp. TaxID=267 RepID=UPI003A896C62